jgi:hypothetical protein
MLPPIAGFMGTTLGISVVMLHLWLVQKTGEPNFVYFQTLVFNVCRILVLVESINSLRLKHFQLKEDSKQKKE